MKKKLAYLWHQIKPIKGILLFLISMFAANFIWKISIDSNDYSSTVILFNQFDITSFSNILTTHITNAVRGALALINIETYALTHNDITFTPRNRIFVVWGCSAIKQSFIFLCIMITAQGKWSRKLWYIPLGLILIYLFNILRISIIAIITHHNPEQFIFWHEYIFKYLFYGFMFLIWVFWEEKINPKKRNKASH